MIRESREGIKDAVHDTILARPTMCLAVGCVANFNARACQRLAAAPRTAAL